LKRRKTKQPEYRCNNGHEFDVPHDDAVDVLEYEAHFENSFIDTPDAVSVSRVKAAALRPSDQLSIEEVDPRQFEDSLVRAWPKAGDLLCRFWQTGSLTASEGDASEANGTEQPGPQGPYLLSPGDHRLAVLRQIRQRRGQQKFRNDLILRYGGRCLVTGCGVLDVIEAAHIWPYRGEKDNHAENGLLLRADIHTLFDLDLLAVSPDRLEIAVAPSVSVVPEYAKLQGSVLLTEADRRPSTAALEHRWLVFSDLWRRQSRQD
jgi:hypothetical protein